jgi:hypothetical protein
MKTLIAVLFILLASSMAFGQRKSKEDPNAIKIDSLTNANKTLSLKADSLSSELVKYMGVYTAVREKVIRYEFDPTRMSYLIDSLQAARDSAFAKLIPVPVQDFSADTIALLKKEIVMLRMNLDSTAKAGTAQLQSLTTEEIERAKAMDNLKKLKELLDSKIITEAEFIAAKKKYMDKL